MKNQPTKKITNMEKQPKKKIFHCNSKANHAGKHPLRKYICNHCNYSSNYKHNLLRHTEFKHPDQHTKKTLKKAKSYLDVKSIKCLCKPMFYTIQNSPKEIKQSKKTTKTKHEDKQ